MPTAWETLKKITKLSDYETLPASLRHEIEKTLEQVKKAETIYQLKIQLRGIRPPIWRRVLVPSDITFDQLHLIIQEAMGWGNYHLYQFETSDAIIDVPHPDDRFMTLWKDKLDSRKTPIKKYLSKEKQKVLYTYDFGDNWDHIITLEKIEKRIEPLTHPICIKGSRACPPEDVGGVWGYQDAIDMMKDDTRKQERQEFLEWYDEWYGDDFDPERFDIEEVNQRLVTIRFK
ncbi:plasmid pRiA4b ORF-3 family protein [Anoxybacillus sp. D401a]|uniref:plasmid pRiA4b ORF-3 family protein n=1 Tax=Anoxybacillus sp. D401a TaxID=575112 RepID=UPI003D34959B